MKFRIGIFVLVLIFACVSFGSFDEPAIIHEWKFEGNALDTSGSGNHGSWVGTASYSSGVFGGQAGYFNGSSWVQKLGANVFPLTAGADADKGWTMNVWVNMYSSDIGDWASIAGFGGTGGPDEGRWIHGVDAKVSFSGTPPWGFSDEPYSIGGWTMVTAVAKDSSFSLYANGELVLDCGWNNPDDVVGRNIFAAGPLFWSGNRFRGKIDDFAIWDGPLEPEQIQNLYSTNKIIPNTAWSPSPADREDWKYYDCSKVKLEWRAGNFATSHDVYFGTDYDEVLNADRQSSAFEGNVDATYYNKNGLQADTWYYWRIDEVNDGNTWPGEIWRFYTEDDWQKEGWVLTFHDEFDGSVLDETKWSIGYPGWHAGNDTPMAFPQDDHSVYQMGGGILGLVNRKQDYNDGVLKHYVSGLIQSKSKFHQAFGWFEARCKMPGYAGDFPAFWLFPNGNTYTPRAEVDIMEHWHREGETVAAHLHWDGYEEDHKSIGSGMYSVPGVWDSFHTYAMKWEPGKLTFYADGVAYWSHSGEEVPSEELWIILNNALDQWTGIDESAMPTYFQVDYVRVYEAAPSCVPEESELLMDLNGDCVVDYNDLARIAASWLRGGSMLVDFHDFSMLADEWLVEDLWP